MKPGLNVQMWRDMPHLSPCARSKNRSEHVAHYGGRPKEGSSMQGDKPPWTSLMMLDNYATCVKHEL